MEHTLEQLEEFLEPYWSEQCVSRQADIGRGWADLGWELTEKLIECPYDFKIVQVKSKFAGLRYYLDFYDPFNPDEPVYPAPEGEDLVRKYENLSYQTCEECGELGTQVSHGRWMSTLCPRHDREATERINKQ